MALALVLLGASWAWAGGPTSVLLVSPTSSKTASLYTTEEDYDRLRVLLDEKADDPGSEPAPRDGEDLGYQINVTWLIHDVSPWRTDQVFPDPPGGDGIWIRTVINHSGNADRAPAGIWHKARNAAELGSLLTKLDVMGEGSSVSSPPPVSPSASAAPLKATASSDDGTDWWWAIPGLVAGAALALLLRPLAGRLAGYARER